MRSSRKKILITGGCGFIGSHTSNILLKKGYSLIIIDSNINSSPKTIERLSEIAISEGINLENKIAFHKGDLRDLQFLNRIFSEQESLGNKVEFVIHFAGLKSVNESNLFPLNYWDVNLVGTLNLLKVMNANDCRNIIFSSSASVYQKKNNSQFSEFDVTKPSNPYGNTKLTIENVLNDIYLSSKKKWKIACLRYFNPIGAHPSGLIGENPSGIPNNIFPLINNVAFGQQKNLRIFGDDWNTPDGTCVRDYIHVMDVALGHVKTLEFLNKVKKKYLIMNLGTGRGTSVLELIRIFEKVNNLKVPFIMSRRRIGDIERVVANNSYSCSTLNWKPEKTIEEMCKDAWNWKQLNPNGYF